MIDKKGLSLSSPKDSKQSKPMQKINYQKELEKIIKNNIEKTSFQSYYYIAVVDRVVLMF